MISSTTSPEHESNEEVERGEVADRPFARHQRYGQHLENHFGTLNENQEEMLAAARAATEAVGVELGRLRDIAGLDRGTLDIRRE